MFMKPALPGEPWTMEGQIMAVVEIPKQAESPNEACLSHTCNLLIEDI